MPPDPPGDRERLARPASLLRRLKSRLKTVKGAIVAIAGVGAVLSGLTGYWNAYQVARAGAESAALLAMVGKGDAGPMSIVVLPFANLTGDPQQAYVADGLTVAVTADLSRFRDLFIVSTTTAMAYRDKPITAQQIGNELGVRFALQGGVQRNGDKILINAQLSDTATNAQLWSENLEGSQEDLLALQEMVTTRLGNSIGRAMVVAAARDSEQRKGDPKAADLMWRAAALGLKPGSRANAQERQSLYRQALLLEPNNVKAMVGLAASLSTAISGGLALDQAAAESQLTEARDLALKAKQLDPNNPDIYLTLAIYASRQGDHEGEIRAQRTALSLAPKNPAAYINLASSYVGVGEPRKAIELIAQVIRMDPNTLEEGRFFVMGIAQFMVGDDEAAIQWLLKGLDLSPDFTWAHAFLAMAYARKGDQVRSQAAAAALLRAHPKIKLSTLGAPTDRDPSAAKEFWEEKLVPAWRLAGLPE